MKSWVFRIANELLLSLRDPPPLTGFAHWEKGCSMFEQTSQKLWFVVNSGEATRMRAFEIID